MPDVLSSVLLGQACLTYWVPSCWARLAQLAAVVGYVVVAIFQIRNYTALTVGAEAFYTPVPDWGWVCAFVVAMLWLWCTAWLGGTAPHPTSV